MTQACSLIKPNLTKLVHEFCRFRSLCSFSWGVVMFEQKHLIFWFIVVVSCCEWPSWCLRTKWALVNLHWFRRKQNASQKFRISGAWQHLLDPRNLGVGSFPVNSLGLAEVRRARWIANALLLTRYFLEINWSVNWCCLVSLLLALVELAVVWWFTPLLVILGTWVLFESEATSSALGSLHGRI